MYIKSNGDVVHHVNARISDRAYKLAQEKKINFSQTLEAAILKHVDLPADKHGDRNGKVNNMSEILELPMSHYNRIQNPLLEAVALIRVKRGTVVIIEDEPETREYKDYDSLIPFTMADILTSSAQH